MSVTMDAYSRVHHLQPRDDTRYAPSPAQLEALGTLIERLWVYIICISAVLITLRVEITYVWPARLSLVKTCYLVNRYLTLLFMAFLSVCTVSERMMEACPKIHLLQPLLPVIIYLCCNYKLIVRCSALFSQPRRVFWPLLFLALAQAGIQVFCSLKNKPIPLPPGVTGCFSNTSKQNSPVWRLVLGNASVCPSRLRCSILLVTLGKVVQDWRTAGPSRIFRRFAHDGILYFAVVASANLVNIVYMRSRVEINGVHFEGGNFNAAMTLVVTSMMVSRLMIHMRKKAAGQIKASNLGVRDPAADKYTTLPAAPMYDLRSAWPRRRQKRSISLSPPGSARRFDRHRRAMPKHSPGSPDQDWAIELERGDHLRENSETRLTTTHYYSRPSYATDSCLTTPVLSDFGWALTSPVLRRSSDVSNPLPLQLSPLSARPPAVEADHAFFPMHLAIDNSRPPRKAIELERRASLRMGAKRPVSAASSESSAWSLSGMEE